jgi:hypothetical protein
MVRASTGLPGTDRYRHSSHDHHGGHIIMSTRLRAEVRRRRFVCVALLVAGAMTVLGPVTALQTGHAAQLKVSSAPIQSWTVQVLLSELPDLPEADFTDLPEADLSVPASPSETGPQPTSPAHPEGTDEVDESPGPEVPTPAPPAPEAVPAPGDLQVSDDMVEVDHFGTP